MLNNDQAKAALLSAQPNVARVVDGVAYREGFLFRVVFKSADEAEWDPFFFVNSATEEVKEFSFLQDGNPREITLLFLANEEGG